MKKLGVMGVKIGYPDKWRDYSALQIKNQPYVLNALACRAFEFKRRLDRIGQPVDPNEWDMTPPTINAYYDPNRNEIVFPAGILQPPNFDPKADDAANYGNTGATIGHEMTHGFDDQGRQYDGQGNLKNWWTFVDMKRFEERGKKIIKQFHEFEPQPGLRVNGRIDRGREHRGPRRAEDRVRGIRGGAGAATRGATRQGGGRFHARAAVFHQLRPELARPDACRGGALAGAGQPAQPGPVSGDRPRGEPARVCARLQPDRAVPRDSARSGAG